MVRNYSEDEKIKYVQGFRNSHYPISDYCYKMNLNYEEFKRWLKEYKDLPKFGMIQLQEKVSTVSVVIPKETTKGVKFESNGIKIELADGYDKDFLVKIMEVIVTC